ncbi:hypothetical protein JTB14_038474 [Gonioctena quinquepunctata]|nr:hypothetical protein JTB14_038474 [Gonioctena quinquepunctata]
MSTVKNVQDVSSGKENTPKPKSDCEKVKAVLLKLFLFIRYYVDVLIDYAFGYFKDSKRVPIKNCSNPIIFESASSLARKIRKLQLTSEDVVQAFIDRIKEVNPVLNAVVDSRYEEALNEAKFIDECIQNGTILDVDFQEKPFLGVPFTTKESTAVKGLAFTLGIVRRKGKRADFDADYIKLIKEAGAICLGVTNIPQLNLWQETHNPIYGITNNPYNTTRNVGGSSGGEATILAAGGTAISLGTDIGGSIRIPAFMCGVFGHKPTSDLIPTKGTTFRTGKEEQTMVVMGLLTRHAEDLMPILKVLVAENASKLKFDQTVDISEVKIYYTCKINDPTISPCRQEMKTIFKRYENSSKHPPGSQRSFIGLYFYLITDIRFQKDFLNTYYGIQFFSGISFRTGNEGETMVNAGPLTKYAEDLAPLLKILVAENVNKLRLDDPVDLRKLEVYYILNPKDPFVSPSRDEMKTSLLRAVNHFQELLGDDPKQVEFEGTKYVGKLWKYWMTQESGANFCRDIMDRQGEANPFIEIVKHFTVGGDYTTSTIFNMVNGLLPTPKDDWARSETEKLRQQMLDILGNNGVLLYPSAPWPAGYHHASYLRPWNFNLFSIWNVLKFPVTQVPMGLSKDGLPLGIQVVAAPYQDRLCFAVAKELERSG